MKKEDQTVKNRHIFTEKRWFLALAIAGMIGSAFLISSVVRIFDCSFLMASSRGGPAVEYSPTPIQLQAIIHYVTSRIVPQQKLWEISLTFEVLKNRSPCNFLVFGLGHDSLRWTALNPRGTTVFLEEDPKWIQTVTKDVLNLRAHAVQYRTKLSQADDLLSHYRFEPDCSPEKAYPRGNTKCKLALTPL